MQRLRAAITRLAGVTEEDAAPAAAQHEGGAQSRWSASGDDNVEHKARAVQEAQPQVWWLPWMLRILISIYLMS